MLLIYTKLKGEQFLIKLKNKMYSDFFLAENLQIFNNHYLLNNESIKIKKKFQQVL